MAGQNSDLIGIDVKSPGQTWNRGPGEFMETRPGIEVDENGQWLYQKMPIRNEGVLRYFKSNLYRVPGRFYILNRFGELREEAYLDAVRGFPLHALRVEVHSERHSSRPAYLQIRLDSGEDTDRSGRAMRVR